MNSILNDFLGCSVMLKIEGYEVKGKLLGFKNENKRVHEASVLIIQNRVVGKVICRGNWQALILKRRES